VADFHRASRTSRQRIVSLTFYWSSLSKTQHLFEHTRLAERDV
jgi:hypothetical protein